MVVKWWVGERLSKFLQSFSEKVGQSIMLDIVLEPLRLGFMTWGSMGKKAAWFPVKWECFLQLSLILDVPNCMRLLEILFQFIRGSLLFSL